MTDALPLTPIEMRTAEVAQYNSNIAMYTAILANLPAEWPVHLNKYKGAKNKHETIATVENLDDVELLSDLWAADDCKAAIRTETVEMRKSLAILNVLKDQLN